MNIYEKLIEIQQGLNAPKNQHNDFGNYNYRSAEDILAAVKPLLAEQGCALVLSDDVVDLGGCSWVCSTATLIDAEASGKMPEGEKMNGQGYVSTTGWAKHALARKGMDDSQVTGTASSYARKYALGGLFCIDDVKDADALEPDRGPQAGKKPTDKGSKPDGAVAVPEGRKRSKELQQVYDMTQLLASVSGEKPGQIAAKLESFVGHPINEELNAAHYARISQWFREQGVTYEG